MEGCMFFINDLKHVLSNYIVLIFLVISYFLIFVAGKELKRKNFLKDSKIVTVTGIIYGILAIAAAAVINFR
jgi:hypothetical protein